MRRGAAYGIHALATPLSEEHDALSHGRSVQTGAFMTFWFAIQTTCTVPVCGFRGTVPGSPARGRVPVKRHRGSRDAYRYMFCTVPVKRHRGEPGHTRDTWGTRAHAGPRGHTDHTDEPHNHPPKPNDTPARPRDGRNRGRLNSRKNSRRPGVDRSPRPTTIVPVQYLYRF